MKKRIILASSSPRRRQLLKQIGLKFTVVASNYEEDMTLKLDPVKLAKFLSRGKAEDIAKKYKNSIIIAADTFIVKGKEILGKPHTKAEAIKTLKKISGKAHFVITGFTIIDTTNNKTVSRAVSTKVFFKKLTEKEMKNYVKSFQLLQKFKFQ